MTEGNSSHQQNQQLLAEITKLQRTIEQLQRDNQDLQIALTTIAEHGDSVEAELYETNVKLNQEVSERQRAEAMLQGLLDIMAKERDDLSIIVETIMEHGDTVDLQWEQKLQETTLLATLDGLTQIPNRRSFDEVYQDYWDRMRDEQVPLSVLLCDIDWFKQYNDIYGHLAGDDCLKQVAQALQQLTLDAGGFAARYGGEEFVILLSAYTLDQTLEFAEKLQSAIAQLQITHTASIPPYLTLSIGAACTIPSDAALPRALVHEADRLLYAAKRQGKNRITHRWIPALGAS